MAVILLLVAYPLTVLFFKAMSFLLSLLRETKEEKHEETITKESAEIDGGSWEQLSVFAHIELGLTKNPNEAAVICMFQPSDCLEDLVSRNGMVQRQNGQPGQQNGGSNISDENFKVQQPNKLWKQQNGSIHFNNFNNGPVAQLPNGDSQLCNGSTHSTCLTLTYKELHDTALRLARGLLANGAHSNTTMVMLIPNGGEYAILLWTCILLRITYVSLDPSSLDISGFTGLKYMLRTLKPQLVVVPDPVSGKAIDVAVSELQLPQPIRLSLSRSNTPGWKSLTDIAAGAVKCSIYEATIVDKARYDNPNRINSIMFTSGTSGFPKGCPQSVAGMSHVLHSQSWLMESGAAAFALQQPHNSRGIAPAQTLQTWKAGGAVVMTGQSFSVRQAAEAIKQFGATFIVLTPPMVHEMAVELAARPIDISSVKHIQIGGDAVTKDVMIKCAALFPASSVFVNHGMTEGGGSFLWPFFKTSVSKIPFFGEICPIGAVAPGSIIRIWDTEKKSVVGRGELGELHISCPSIINHYLGGRSEESFYDDRKGRWFKTGDIAMMDRDGLVFILGRRKDMIKRAGVAIMPAAIESSIEAFTGAQTIVVPVPHHVLGTEPFAVLSSYNGITEAILKEHTRSVLGRDYELGGLASLKQLGLVDFPLNATHKIIKSELQTAVLKYLKGRSEVSGQLHNQ